MENIEFDAQAYLRNPISIRNYNQHISSKVLSKICWCDFREIADVPCISIIERAKIRYLMSLDLAIYPNLIRVFYTNLESSSTTPGGFVTRVNGVKLTVTPNFINGLIHSNIPDTVQASTNKQFKDLPGISEQEAMDFVLRDAIVPHSYSTIHPLKKVDLSCDMQVFTELIQSLLLPRKGHVDTVNTLDIWVMGALGLGVPLDIGYLICRHMINARIHPQQSLPYACLITHILGKFNVPISDDEPTIEVPARNYINEATFFAKNWQKHHGQWRMRPRRTPGEASSSKRPRTEDEGQAAAAEPSEHRSTVDERLDILMASIGSLSDSIQSLHTYVERRFDEQSQRLDAHSQQLHDIEKKVDSYFGDI